MQIANTRLVWTIGLLGFSVVAMAAKSVPSPKPPHPQEPIGFVTGAVIGAFAGGPLGAVFGAGLGTWLGNRVHRATDAAHAEARVAVLESAAAQPPAQLLPAGAVDSAALDGLQGDVLFRTGSADITPEIAHQVQVLAQAVIKTPNLTVRIDGYADRRGSDTFNQKLSQDRADAVHDLLLAAGVAERAMEINAYGKTQSVAQDVDGFALERRVRLTLKAENGTALVSVSAIGLR